MGVSEILASIDREIALLKQVRALLSGASASTPRKVGRPKKSAAPAPLVAAPATDFTPKRKKRRLSPEGRRRIAEAVKRRWAAQKKTAAPSK